MEMTFSNRTSPGHQAQTPTRRENEIAYFTLPWRAGESHVTLGKVLRSKAKWILKVSPDSAGDGHGTIHAVFFRFARSASWQCGARSDGDFVYRLAGDAVRRPELLRL